MFLLVVDKKTQASCSKFQFLSLSQINFMAWYNAMNEYSNLLRYTYFWGSLSPKHLCWQEGYSLQRGRLSQCQTPSENHLQGGGN